LKSLCISLAQLDYHTGNFEKNAQKIIEHIHAAKQESIDIIVFSELCICGYPPRDFLEFSDFIKRCEDNINAIALHCVGIAAIVGAPSVNPVPEGKDLYNSAYFLADGKIIDVVHKTLLPNYDIFDEYRYFEPNRIFKTIVYQNWNIAITICEDLWNINENPMYIINPMDELMKQHPEVMINIAASPFNKNQLEQRKQVMIDNVNKYKIPLFYTNHIGAQTQLIFDGGSMVVNADGTIADTLGYFIENRKNYVLHKQEINTSVLCKQSVSLEEPQIMQRIHQALVLGIREYFQKQGFTKALLGLSGGIDSALVLALAVDALGNENVKAVLLPSRFSSNHSIKDATQLAQNLRVHYETISIEPTFNALEQTLKKQFEGTTFNITEENMQSRSRGIILMALCNKFGYILLNTSNKSELAVGYGTLYGDMCGGLSVIGDLYKTEVVALCEYYNKENEVIPHNIITKPPSAELRPDQKDSDSLPDYILLDKILQLYVEERKGPSEIIAAGCDEVMVKKVLKMVNMNEWKRLQAPPVLRVSTKAFGPGRRMPIVAKYLS
jgi:NAD+ synthase (glutamine-hydrolysing)